MGVSAAWARLFFLYGPGEHPDRFVASTIRAMIKGQIAICGNGSLRRDYIFVKDAAQAITRLLLSDVEGAINIGTGTAVELAYLARNLAGILNSESLLHFGQNPAAEPPIVIAGQGRLRGELGWLPSYTLDQALAESVAWWQNQLRCELTPISV
jgi:nucleoside-diphosphate-sugar epimerase